MLLLLECHVKKNLNPYHTDWELTTKALACTKRILITHSYISCLSYSTDDINWNICIIEIINEGSINTTSMYNNIVILPILIKLHVCDINVETNAKVVIVHNKPQMVTNKILLYNQSNLCILLKMVWPSII